jgi:hypothetical protein
LKKAEMPYKIEPSADREENTEMYAESKYVALGIIIGLALANVFPLLRQDDSFLKLFLKILPFLLLVPMFIVSLYQMKKRDKKNKG